MSEAEVASPELAPATADSPVGLDVTVSCTTPGAAIRYTLNGAEPTRFDPAVLSGGTVRVSRNAVVKAKAWLANESSATTTEDYRITGAVAAGDQHGLALSVSGRVWSWGNQNHGRLGNGLSASAQVLNPVQVLHGAGNFETGAGLAAGFTHSLVQDQQGAVWSFGRNDSGQLGNNTTGDSALPLQVKTSVSPLAYLANARAIAAGQDWSMVVRTDGSLLTWGSQATGRLSSGSTSGNRLLPGVVQRGDDGAYPALAGIRGIAAAPAFGLARKPHALEVDGGTGEVWAWGYNNSGQLCQGNTSNLTRAMPVKRNGTTLLTDVLDVSAGEGHAVFLRWHATEPALQGSVWTAGNRAYGRLGNGSTAIGAVTFPTPVLKDATTPLDGIEQIAAGAAHTLALDGDGHVWSWGYNGYGQLGDGTNVNRGYAEKVKDPAGTGVLSGIVRIAAGGDGLAGASMAVAADGSIYVWGRNNQGQLGNGETTQLATKLPVAHARNHVAEGEPSLTLAHSVTAAYEDGSISVTAMPTHSGAGGVENIDRVEIRLNGQLAATFTGGTWSGSIGNLDAGTYHGYGVAYDDDGLMAMSAPFTFDITLDPAGDKDGDGLTNGEEAALGTFPDNPDSDGDGMEDGYEKFYEFPVLDQTNDTVAKYGPENDKDGDGRINRIEARDGSLPRSNGEGLALLGSDPLKRVEWFGKRGVRYRIKWYNFNASAYAYYAPVFVGDNVKISVLLSEMTGGYNPPIFFATLHYFPTAEGDEDIDGLPDWEELDRNTDPHNADSDGDGLKDGWEVANGLDPLDPSGNNGSGGDADGDGVDNGFEQGNGSNANDAGDFPAMIRSVSHSADGNSNSSSTAPTNGNVRTKDWNAWEWSPPESVSQHITPGTLKGKLEGMELPETLNEALSSDAEFVALSADEAQAYASFYRNDPAYPAHHRNGDTTVTRCWVRAPEKSQAQHLPFVKIESSSKSGGDMEEDGVELVDAQMVSATIAADETDSDPIDLEPEATLEEGYTSDTTIQLLRFETAPEVLAVNSDCDDDYLALEAVRDHLDGKFKVNQRVTDDMHRGWFGVNPASLDDRLLEGATITIRKVDKIDSETGHKESGHVRFYVKWGEGTSQYRAITPYDLDSLAPVNLVNGGVNNSPQESVYGENRVAGTYYMEGVHPGKITLEWRLQKGDIDITHEQSFEIYTKKTALQWRFDLAYKIRLETSNDPSGQVYIEELPLPVDTYKTRVERVSEFYDFYRECHQEPLRSNPSGYPHALTWAGLARLAGNQAVAGLSDSQYGRNMLALSEGAILAGPAAQYVADAVAGWTVAEIDQLQLALVTGGRSIFTSIGWMHHAYRSSGYRAIEHVADTTLNPDAVALASTWENLHQGVLDHNRLLIKDAAVGIADREQNEIIVPAWNTISGLAGGLADDMFSILGKNPCFPGGLDFIDVFPPAPGNPFPIPSGSLASTADRWMWVKPETTGGIIDTWSALPQTDQLILSGDSTNNDARRFSMFAGLPLIDLPVLSWDHLDAP